MPLVISGKKKVRDRHGTPKNLYAKDFAELSGELSGVICLKALVLSGSARELFRKCFGAVRAIFWPLKGSTKIKTFLVRRPLGGNPVKHCLGWVPKESAEKHLENSQEEPKNTRKTGKKRTTPAENSCSGLLFGSFVRHLPWDPTAILFGCFLHFLISLSAGNSLVLI